MTPAELSAFAEEIGEARAALHPLLDRIAGLCNRTEDLPHLEDLAESLDGAFDGVHGLDAYLWAAQAAARNLSVWGTKLQGERSPASAEEPAP